MITCLALSPSLDVTYLVDSLEPGAIARPRETHKVAGGKGLNVARVAARLGAPVTAIALLGGSTGDRITALLADSGIGLDVVPVAGETRTCVSIAPDDDDRLTEVYEASAPVSAEALVSVETLMAETEAGDWLVLSGSLPPGLEPEELASELAAAREAGVRVAVDTSGSALSAMLVARPEVVKVNRSEAAEVLGTPEGSAADLANGLREGTGGIVVVTDGVHGSIAIGDDGVVRMPPARVPGRFPVGSGDSFLAGLVVSLSRGDDLEAAMRLGAACAQANAQVPGAAVFSTADLDAALDAAGEDAAGEDAAAGDAADEDAPAGDAADLERRGD